MMKWCDVIKPKSCGALGLRDQEKKNWSLLVMPIGGRLFLQRLGRIGRAGCLNLVLVIVCQPFGSGGYCISGDYAYGEGEVL